jgi:TolB-like protein/Flp pilus assembly protein TadD
MDSLAVLPLDNLSRDPEQEYFADGMTDALITDLAQIPVLRIIARTSVMRFKGSSKALPEIANELNVSGIVTGTVLLAGGHVRISVQLTDPRTDRVVWAQRYERPLSDVLSLQDDVARAVAREIRVSAGGVPPATPRTVNSEVYVEYLRARHHWQGYSEPEIRKAMTILEGALARDSGYAPAFAGLAICCTGLGWLGAELPVRTFPRAKEMARRALSLDDSLAEAYCALGYVAAFYDWDAAEAERTLGRALELQPGSADAHLFYAWLQTSIGNHAGAQSATRRALELDPLSPLVLGNVAYLAIFDRRYEDAERFARQALDLDPSVLERWTLGITLTCLGRYDEGVRELDEAVRMWPGAPMLGWLGYACARAGRTGRARDLLARLEAIPAELVARATELARVLAGLGDHERALAALADACDQREGVLAYLGSDPCWDSIADDPRFVAILRRRGLAGRSRPLPAGHQPGPP